MQCSLDRLIAPSFYKVHNSIEDYTHFWLCGGRGSTKSHLADGIINSVCYCLSRRSLADGS